YSILDLHHNIRSGWANNQDHLNFIKNQLTELLTQYGEITCLVIDGWDADWSRISYDDISFTEIYRHIKSLQP
ncbi:MAG: carbohydrate-binding protein, partial [Bacteroidales bacterium]